MKSFSVSDLKSMAREYIGRDLSDDEAEYYRHRLPMVARAAGILRDVEPRLRDTEPACVHKVVRDRK